MNIRIRLIFICFFFVFAGSKTSMAQLPGQDEELANQYFLNGEFAKALPLFQKLYEKENTSLAFYKGVYNCMLNLQQYEEAVKFVKKVSKKNSEEPTYLVDWGNIYLYQSNKKLAETQFQNALKLLTNNSNQVHRLATAFLNINQYAYAIETYQKGNKLSTDPVLYNIDLAKVYNSTGDVAGCVAAFLGILEYHSGDEVLIQSYLQDLIQNPKYAEELQSALYKEVQKNSDNNVMYDMLIWYFIQKKDFDMAFIQVKALDKRNKENGSRMFVFAKSAFDEGYYDAAQNAYTYLITEKGNGSNYYAPARAGLINVMKSKIMISGSFTQNDLFLLKKNYLDFFNEFGKNSSTLQTIRDFANIEARYLFDIDTAILILNEALTIPSNDKKMKQGYLKLDLGDYLLMKGEIWDATLLYSQVDKDFGDDALGEEARFRNAKLSYYSCDFEYAQAMLNVLKGATSELVSNDAISLSVFLLDNMGMDTTTEGMCLYANAELLQMQNKNADAISTLDTLQKKFPDGALADDIVFQKGMIYLSSYNYNKAVEYFTMVDSTYSYDLLGDDALFHLAELYQYHLKDTAKAINLYKKLIIQYKGSIYSVEARKRFRNLNGDNIN